MIFDYFASKREILLEYYDRIPIASIQRMKNRYFFLYAIEIDNLKKAKYIITEIEKEEIEEIKKIPRLFLEKKKEKNSLFLYNFSFVSGIENTRIEILKTFDGIKLPPRSFIFKEDYSKEAYWVI